MIGIFSFIRFCVKGIVFFIFLIIIIGIMGLICKIFIILFCILFFLYFYIFMLKFMLSFLVVLIFNFKFVNNFLFSLKVGFFKFFKVFKNKGLILLFLKFFLSIFKVLLGVFNFI